MTKRNQLAKWLRDERRCNITCYYSMSGTTRKGLRGFSATIEYNDVTCDFNVESVNKPSKRDVMRMVISSREDYESELKTLFTDEEIELLDDILNNKNGAYIFNDPQNAKRKFERGERKMISATKAKKLIKDLKSKEHPEYGLTSFKGCRLSRGDCDLIYLYCEDIINNGKITLRKPLGDIATVLSKYGLTERKEDEYDGFFL